MKWINLASARWAFTACILLTCVGCDQWTKKIAGEQLQQSVPLSYLGDTLRIQYAENPGAFLGAGSGLSVASRFWILVVANAVFLLAIAAIISLKRSLANGQICALALLLAGGLGNLIDRLYHEGLVVDFLNVGLGPVRTGIFNVADMAILAGFLLLLLWRSPAAIDDLAIPANRPQH